MAVEHAEDQVKRPVPPGLHHLGKCLPCRLIMRAVEPQLPAARQEASEPAIGEALQPRGPLDQAQTQGERVWGE